MRRSKLAAKLGPLEISVTALPKPPGDDEEYALVNINRWRGQLALPPIVREQLASETTSVPLEGATATVVNLLGHGQAWRHGSPAFLSRSRQWQLTPWRMTNARN